MYREQILKDEKRNIQKSENNKKKKKYTHTKKKTQTNKNQKELHRGQLNHRIKKKPALIILLPYINTSAK